MGFTAFIIRCIRPFAVVFYGAIKLVRRPSDKVVFLSRQSDHLPVDFVLLKAELAAKDRSLKIQTLCCSDATCRKRFLGHFTKTVAELWAIASARAVILDGYSVAVSWFPQRSSLYVLQCWHALGGIKRFSWQALDTPGGRPRALAEALRMHANYTNLLCGGRASIVTFSHAFHVPRARIRPLALPRCDVLRAPDLNRIDHLMAAHPALFRGRPLVFYAPTFRDTDAAYERWLQALDELAAACAEHDYTLVVKTHFRSDDRVTERARHTAAVPDVGESSPTYASDARPAGVATGSGTYSPAVTRHAHVHVNPPIDTLDLLVLADHVVTDYSAVAFEAAVAGKPLWFYVFDIDDYVRERGLNVDPRAEMPDAACADARELCARMSAVTVPTAEQQQFLERYVALSHIPAARQIARLVLENLHIIERKG
ncbi:MAG: CDP-glycerol glycerophosphotransferase family protein [Actinomycetes bacterium]|jgi:CDP-ribitol ribitolphosphotransferase|nr:CDP-glycerol glycerophosphotransferase family protein [Actinomycetes bacterium]